MDGTGKRSHQSVKPVHPQARLLADLTLDGAIRMSQVVLRFAAENGIGAGKASDEIAAMPDDWFDAQEEYAQHR